jgi:hypothetical protein
MSENVLKIIERDENGLIKGLTYQFTEEGYIDWRKMLPTQYLYTKGEEQDITKVDDSQLIVNLAGMRYLAKLRGMNSYRYEIHRATDTYAAVLCHIDWLKNYEQNAVFSEAVASATLETTNELTSKYILETAQNRAFCRAVREYLNIKIVSQEELNSTPKKTDDISVSPKDSNDGIDIYKVLDDAMLSKNVGWVWLKSRLVDLKMENAENFQTIRDIPKSKVFTVIERLKKYKAKV